MSGESWCQRSDDGPGSAPAGEARLRLVAHRCVRNRAGVCRMDVELESAHGRRAVGEAQGVTNATGELRLAAEATLRAIDASLDGAVRFDLLGVKSVRAFDATVVIVAVATERLGEPLRLLGCVHAGESPDRAAVLATLDATNRVCALAVTR